MKLFRVTMKLKPESPRAKQRMVWVYLVHAEDAVEARSVLRTNEGARIRMDLTPRMEVLVEEETNPIIKLAEEIERI